MTGYPDYQLGYIRDRQTIAILGGIWHDVRMAYDEANLLIYKGVHETHDSAITNADWEVWKYTYSGTNCVRIEGPLRGTWDGRAALDLGA